VRPNVPPPRPHDPDDRVTLGRIGEWEVRRFEEDGALFGYSAPRGFLHLQLWHPRRAVSLLTPSRLTAGRYEAFPIAGWKLAVKSLEVIGGVIRAEHGLVLPCEARVRALERWFVTAPERSAVRAWMAKRLTAERAAQVGSRLGMLLVVLFFSIACARAPIPSTAEADGRQFERDRRAILAMAGEFEVSFDFRETTALALGYELRAPSRSAGFERVAPPSASRR
jgi:hypothetical protein